MRIGALTVAVALVAAPLGANAADLVVWWDKGYYAEEDAAVREIIAAFEQETGKRVEVAFYSDSELPTKIDAAIEAGEPPDFAFGLQVADYISKWALEDRLVDLTDAVGHFSDPFDPDALAWWTLLNEKTGREALYALPMGRTTLHLHVWKSLLEQAGFSLEDIPSEWDAFWLFWCDDVQPAVRRATGRHDIWGIGLAMSSVWGDTNGTFRQFVNAYEADWVTREGLTVIDESQSGAV